MYLTRMNILLLLDGMFHTCLLGSFGDNELSVECLYGTQRFLHQDGIYIPRNCTSHLACCMSTRIYNNV